MDNNNNNSNLTKRALGGKSSSSSLSMARSSPPTPRRLKEEEDDDDHDDHDDGSEHSVPMERKDSVTVAQLRRLASKENAGATTSPNSPNPLLASSNRRQSLSSHADIRNFIEKQSRKSSALKELLRHFVFTVILLAVVTLSRSAYESYLMNQALITAFVTEEADFELQPFVKTFEDVGTVGEFSAWLTSVVGGLLDQNQFYSGKNMTETERDYIMFSNRLLGGVRLRQLRAAPNKGCKLPNQLKELTYSKGVCYSYEYSGSTRDTTPFGPPEQPDKYKYQSAKECGSVSIFGYILDYLEGGGYVVDVALEDRDNVSFTDAFQELIDDTWIDVQTRAVIITMNFLNQELESRVAVLYLILEMPGNGAMFPSFMIKTFRLNLYVTSLDYFRLFLEIVILLMVLFSFFGEFREMVACYRSGGLRKYFYNGWNLIELLDLVLYVVTIILYVRYIAAPGRYDVDLDVRRYFPEMEQIAASALIVYNVAAVNVIITVFRTFKYLRLNNRLYILWKTLRHAGADLIGFLFIFLIIIFGFIFMGWLSFGADLIEYNSFVHSFATCWNFIIGNAPDYNAMAHSNRILGPFFFTLFTIFIFFILANMFIAILSNSFEYVSDDKRSVKIMDVLEEKIETIINTFSKAYNLVIHKGKIPKRSIMKLLDELQHPEFLDKKNVTRDDVASAIGPSATPAEIDDLHQWIRKLESKKQKKNSTVFPTPDDEETGSEEDSSRELEKMTSKRGLAPQQDFAEMKYALEQLQAESKEMKSLLLQLLSRTP